MAKRITATKNHRVSLSPRNGWGMYVGGGGTRFTVTSDELAGEYATNDWGRTWAKIVKVYVYLDGLSIDEAVDQLREKSAGLADATLDIDRNDDGYPESNVVGRRDATEAEVAEVLRYLEFDKEQRAVRDENIREALIRQAKSIGLKPEDLA